MSDRARGRPRHRRGIALAAAIALLGLALGCGGGRAGSDASTSAGSWSASRAGEGLPSVVAPSHCPSGLPSCRTAEGRIAYVERVDPDGDGDAHFVIVDLPGISLPGLTAIDVRKGLRPQPLPGVGELISAAGPVQTGSYGQSQIHAVELHVARR